MDLPSAWSSLLRLAISLKTLHLPLAHSKYLPPKRWLSLHLRTLSKYRRRTSPSLSSIPLTFIILICQIYPFSIPHHISSQNPYIRHTIHPLFFQAFITPSNLFISMEVSTILSPRSQ